MQTSSMREGSRLGFAARVARRTWDRSSSGYASLKPPFFARVTGVRRAERITMSVGCFWRMFWRPLWIVPLTAMVMEEVFERA